MSSTMKAAAVAAVVFLAIVAGYFLLIQESEPPVVMDDGGGGYTETDVVDETAEPGTFEPPVQIERDPVVVTVEVRDKRRDRVLEGVSLFVNRAHEGNRLGERLIERKGKPKSPGTFEINLEPGAYMVRAECPRFSGERRPVVVVKDQPQTVVFHLERGSTISGRVLTANGEGIGGAKVIGLKELGNPEADMETMLIGLVDLPNVTNAVAAEAFTEPDGSYQLDGLKPEWYTVRAIADGYTPGSIQDVPAPRSKVDIRLQDGGQLSGVVMDTDGNPVQEAEINAYKHLDSQNIFEIIMAKSRPPIDTVTTDAAGQFSFQTLGAGTFNFLITGIGYQQETILRFFSSGDGSDTLKVELKPGLSIEGYVQDPEGNPVAGAKVRASRSGGATTPGDQVAIDFKQNDVVTDESGFFVFDTLQKGKYILLCWHDDFKTFRRQGVYPGKGEITLKMDYGGRLSGIVTDSSGAPVPGARVSASDVADLRKETVTEENGYYVLPGVVTGRRSVSVTVSAKGYARARRDVKVKKEEELKEDFQLEPTCRLGGLVLNTNQDPVANARVMIKRRGGNNAGVEQTVGTGITDRQGRFQVEDVEGGESIWLVVKKSEYLDGRSEEFSIGAGEEFDAEPVELRLGGALAGRVMTSGGQPVTGCMVTIQYEGDTELTIAGNPSSGTNARGEFRIQGLENATVDLVVKAPRHLETVVKRIEIREGDVHAGIEITLEEGNTVAGRVVTVDGEGIRGAKVIARDYSEGVKEMSAKTDANGRFRLENILSESTVEIEVVDNSYGGFVDEEVKVGTEDLEIVLKELGKLVGTVEIGGDSELKSFSVHPQLTGDRSDPRKELKSKTFSFGEDGTFEYTGVTAGEYVVHVGAPSFAAATIENVVVKEGESVDLGSILLEVGGMITGQIIDPDTGDPISQARVQVVQGTSRFLKGVGNEGGKGKATQITDTEGYFSFTNLRGGELSLRVTKNGYSSRVVEGVNPDVGASSKELKIELSHGAQISGVVVGKAGSPERRMPVYLIGATPQQNQSTNTDNRGRFHFVGVEAGPYTVKAHRFVAGQGYRSEAEAQVELRAGTTEKVTLRVE